MSSPIFDIETGPQDRDFVLSLFDESAVKYGNLRDERKRAVKLEEEREKFVDKAALSATTGRVVAIGYRRIDGEKKIIGTGAWAEAQLLEGFWETFRRSHKNKDRIIGFNSNHFDLPFLFRRSVILGVDVPDEAKDRRGYWSDTFVDLLDVWRCGDWTLYIKLNVLAKLMRIKGKPDDCAAADFYKLWESDDPKERKKAERYLENDLDMTYELALRMGVI